MFATICAGGTVMSAKLRRMVLPNVLRVQRGETNSIRNRARDCGWNWFHLVEHAGHLEGPSGEASRSLRFRPRKWWRTCASGKWMAIVLANLGTRARLRMELVSP